MNIFHKIIYVITLTASIALYAQTENSIKIKENLISYEKYSLTTFRYFLSINKVGGFIMDKTKKNFTSDQEIRWCPGCGDYAILRAMQKALPHGTS